MRTNTRRIGNNRERGSALVLFTCILAFVILPIVGLAIDGTIAFIVKTKLSAAIDAASLAAARSLNVGLDIDSQRQSAIDTARAYFSANFPTGLMGASAQIDTPDVEQTQTSVRTVTISGTATAPLYFLRMFGLSNTTVSATGQASRRDVNVMLVLDRSGSMQTSGVCGTMKSSAQDFVNKFANQRDRVGLVTFLGSAHVDFAQSLNFKPDLASEISLLRCAGSTGSAEALSRAHDEFMNNGKLLYPGDLNVIVFFTDGQPNGVTGHFQIKNPGCISPNGYLDGFLSSNGGVYDATGVPISSSNEKLLQPPDANGCKFQGRASLVSQDVYGIPPTDLFQNKTQGYKNTPAQTPIPINRNTVAATSWNAADDAAYRIRQDGILIYCIGESRGVDSVLLKRIANTPDSTSFDPKLPVGKYYYSPDGGQLSSAFSSIASQILTISQ